MRNKFCCCLYFFISRHAQCKNQELCTVKDRFGYYSKPMSIYLCPNKKVVLESKSSSSFKSHDPLLLQMVKQRLQKKYISARPHHFVYEKFTPVVDCNWASSYTLPSEVKAIIVNIDILSQVSCHQTVGFFHTSAPNLIKYLTPKPQLLQCRSYS